MTSAPRSAKCKVQTGPGSNRVKSRMRMPESGLARIGCLSGRYFLGAGIKLRKTLLDHRTVRCPRMAGIKQPGALASTLRALVPRTQRINGLKCRRGKRPKQLQQVGTAFGATEQFARLLRPPTLDLQPLEYLEVRRDVSAHVI